MRIKLIDNTTNPRYKPPSGVLDQIVKATRGWIKQCTKDWGQYVASISKDLDGYPISLEDQLDVSGALGYHDLDQNGKPYGKIGVGVVLDNGGTWTQGANSVSCVITHEVLELIGDPLANRWCDVGPTTETAQELCDAVQSDVTVINGVAVSDYLLPAWFNPFAPPPYDKLNFLTKPFQVRGYAINRVSGKTTLVWGDVPMPPAIARAKTLKHSRYVGRGGKAHV